MLHRIVVVLLSVQLLLVPIALASTSPTESAETFVQGIGDQAIKILENGKISMSDREGQLRGVLAKGFDLPLLARLALGRTYRSLDGNQRSDYEELFNDYILKTYSRRFSGFHGIDLKIEGATALNDKDVLVKSVISSEDGSPIKVDWRVRNTGSSPQIIDVVIEGVSMVITQRQEFQSIVQSQGVNGLLSILRGRAERASASSS